MTKNPFGNMSNIMKQAQAMQEKMARVQEQAATKTVEATAGGGMVTVVVNGAMEVISVNIDQEVIQELIKTGEKEDLQVLITAATNEALRKSRDMMAEEMKGVTGGLQIPGLM